MSDANNDSRQKAAMEWHKAMHPSHFTLPPGIDLTFKPHIGAKDDFIHDIQRGVMENLTPPTREWYLKLHKSLCNRMIEITARKNADYTGGSAENDAFANFRQVERLGICDAETGFLTRMTDKMSRINSFVKKGELKVKDESVEDTLLDLANYCLLMLGYIRSKK
jgi:hypothetical protein